jgi:hypothetical protein
VRGHKRKSSPKGASKNIPTKVYHRKEEKSMVSLWEKAAAIAIKLEQIDRFLIIRPEQVLQKATEEEIAFYYERMCCDNGPET